MNKFIIPTVLVAVLITASSISGCSTTALSKVVTQEKNLAGFASVDIAGPFVVEIIQSDSYDTTITAEKRMIGCIVASQEGTTLNISLKDGVTACSTPLDVRIAMPSLQELRLDEAASGTITGFESANDLTVRLSGGSSLNGHVDAGNMEFELSEASKAVLEGSANDIRLTASGASTPDLRDFIVHNAIVTLSETSWANMNVTERLVADLSGASKLAYTGDPATVESNVSADSEMGKVAPASGGG